MEQASEAYLQDGLAPATAKRYVGAWARFVELCKMWGCDSLPVTEEKAVAYVTMLAEEGLQAATVNYHLAGLRQAHIKAGIQVPKWGTMAKLAQLRKGIARRRAMQCTTGPEKEPVSGRHMAALHDA